MIAHTDPFKADPRISRVAFTRVLRERAAPPVLAERDAGDYWDAITRLGVDPLFVAAMFQHESQMGRFGVAAQTHSWGNTRAPSFGAVPVGEVPGRSGTFPVFATWLDGCISTAARLVAPEWVYAGRTQIGEIFDHPSGQVWAPAGDQNDPAGYLRAVLDFMNTHNDIEDGMSEITHPGHVVGTFKKPPKGIILHGSRSSRTLDPTGAPWTRHQEFTSTASWAMNDNNPYGWNVTLGEDEYATHMRLDQYGLNAGTKESALYLAVEFAQNLVTTSITDAQVRSFVRWFRQDAEPCWPHLYAVLMGDGGMPAHSELPQGIHDNKSDVFPARDGRLPALRERIRAMLKGDAVDPNDVALERLWLQERLRLGERRYAATYKRTWAGAKILVCQRGVLAADAGVSWDITQRCLEDWETVYGKPLKGNGDLVRWGD